MAWGIWNKIKNGFINCFNWIKDKIVKPLIKVAPDIIKNIGPALANMPGKAGIIGKAMTTVSPIIQSLTKNNKQYD